jgi:hypothetical protein
MPDETPPKLRADGEPDGRGRSVGSEQTRFKPGDGRPRPGRRKHSKDERTIVQSVSDMPVTVTRPDGKKSKITTFEAILIKQRQLALEGNLRSAEFMMKHIGKYELPPVDTNRTSDLLAEDQLILEVARRRGVLPAHAADNDGGEA